MGYAFILFKPSTISEGGKIVIFKAICDKWYQQAFMMKMFLAFRLMNIKVTSK